MRILLNEDELREGVRRLADEINQIYHQQSLTIVGVMTGSIVLLADVIRLLTVPLRVGVVQASSYRGGTTRGELVINSEWMPDIKDRNVLLIDDIFDTGHTLAEVVQSMWKLEPKTVRSAVLLRKVGRQQVEMNPDFAVFEIPDEFVVGYGLDYQDAYRNLPYVAALEADDLGPTGSTP